MVELTELVNTLVDGGVLLVIILQRQQVDQGWQNLAERDVLGVGHDHSRETACGIVLDSRSRDL